jgi:hypothetical protein
MNKNYYLILSIGEMEDMLRATRKAARKSPAHPGKAPKRFVKVIRMETSGENFPGQISSTSFMASASS